jgi:ArsR family transcriptional regulator
MDCDAELFQSLADSTRLRLLNLFLQAGEICVCEMVDALEVPQYNVSRHLHVLASAGWLEDRRLGKWVYYRISEKLKPHQRSVLRAVEQLRRERQDFQEDERRAGRRLRLRRGGVCCVGLVSRIGMALSRRNKSEAAKA